MSSDGPTAIDTPSRDCIRRRIAWKTSSTSFTRTLAVKAKQWHVREEPVVRKYRQATDQIFLDRIADGTLRVDTKRARVWVRRGKRWQRLTINWDSRERYQFVRVYQRGARKAIALHRLVWIAAHRRLVPAGCEIHHKRGRGKNGIEHLECLSHGEHLARTYGYPPSWDEVEPDF